MSNTNKELLAITARIERAGRDLGMFNDSEEQLVLSIGSKTYGRAFRLHVTNRMRSDGTRSTGHYQWMGMGDYLGMTKTEASAVLFAIAGALESANHALRTNNV